MLRFDFLIQVLEKCNNNLLESFCREGLGTFIQKITTSQSTCLEKDLPSILLESEKRGIKVDWEKMLNGSTGNIFQIAYSKVDVSNQGITSLLKKSLILGKLEMTRFLMETNSIVSVDRKLFYDLLYSDEPLDIELVEYLHNRCGLDMMNYSCNVLKLLHIQNQSAEYILCNIPFMEEHFFTICFFGTKKLFTRYVKEKVPSNFKFSTDLSKLLKKYSNFKVNEYLVGYDDSYPAQRWHVSQILFDIYRDLPAESKFCLSEIANHINRTSDREGLEFLLEIEADFPPQDLLDLNLNSEFDDIFSESNGQYSNYYFDSYDN